MKERLPRIRLPRERKPFPRLTRREQTEAEETLLYYKDWDALESEKFHERLWADD